MFPNYDDQTWKVFGESRAPALLARHPAPAEEYVVTMPAGLLRDFFGNEAPNVWFANMVN